MIVSLKNSIRYILSSSVTRYDFDFIALQEDALIISVSNSGSAEAVKLNLNSDYTVTINDNGAGYITIHRTAILSQYKYLLISRIVGITQGTDLRNGDNLDAEVLENSLDKLTAIAQQISNKLDLTIQSDSFDPEIALVLPPVNQRKDSVIGFDATGRNLVMYYSPKFYADAAAKSAETAVDAAESASKSKDAAEQAKNDTAEIKKTALESITSAKNEVLDAIKQAQEAGLTSLVDRAEKLTVELDGIADRIKDSEEHADQAASDAEIAVSEAVNYAGLIVKEAEKISIYIESLESMEAGARDAAERAKESAGRAASSESAAAQSKQDTAAIKSETQTLADEVAENKAAVDANVTHVDSVKSSVDATRSTTESIKNQAEVIRQQTADLIETVAGLASQSVTMPVVVENTGKILGVSGVVIDGRLYLRTTETT